MSELGELRLPDVVTFLNVCRRGSLSAAARDMRVTTSQVSKAITRLEKVLGRPLLARRPRGVAVNEQATDLVPKLEALLEQVRVISAPRDADARTRLTVAAPTYLGTVFLPVLASALTDTRVRAVEVVPSFVRAFATENVFEMALTLGAERLAPRWVATRVATLRRGLFASPAVAKRLGARPTPAKLREVPFVLPVYNSAGQFLPGDDGCPLPRSERIVGHEVASIGVGLEIAAACDCLAFGPALAARQLVLAKRLVEIKVPGWQLSDSLYVHADSDRVLARVQKTAIDALRRAAM